jgi:hypothetical protein
LRERYVRQTTIAWGGGARRIVRPRPPVKRTERATVEVLHEAQAASVVEDAYPETRDHEGHVGHVVSKGEHQQSYARLDQWLADTFGDIYVYDETTNPYVRRNIGKYVPQNWQAVCINGRECRKGGNIIRVLLAWHTAIAYALEVALEPLQLDDIKYNVGFVFAEDRRAEHREANDAHVFTLRPVNSDGKLDYAVRNRGSLKRLMTLAKHEVAHVAHSWHSEDFSSLREAIDERFYDAECTRRIKAALDALPELDVEQRWAA